MKLLAALVLAGAACTACDVTPDTATTSSTSTPRPSGSVAVAPPSATVAPTPTAAPKTVAPPPPAPTNPPPPPPPAITIKAIPTRGNRGTNFVFQFSGFPTSPNGLDIIQTVTLPNGTKLAPKTFSAAPNGTGLSTYTPNVSDPSGQYVITLQVAGGGASAFTIIIVD
jgi:hypothetical protein